jgi:serine/threonine protein kinase
VLYLYCLLSKVLSPLTIPLFVLFVWDFTVQFRSPEEYLYIPETAAIDVYSLGNIFYAILQGEWVWAEQFRHEKDAQKPVTRGERPPIRPDLEQSKNPYTQALIRAMRDCWIHDPVERATSRQIEESLRESLEQLTKTRTKEHTHPSAGL